MVITEPVPDVLEEIGWTGGECITDSRAMIHYFRTTPDGRIAFGWGGGRVVRRRPHRRPRRGRPRRRRARSSATCCRFFPALQGRRIEHAWGGPIDVSPSHLPVVGELEPGDPLRVRLHRQRRRARRTWSAAPSPRWRSTATTSRPPRVRRRPSRSGPARAVSLHRRHDHPARDPAQGGGDGARRNARAG